MNTSAVSTNAPLAIAKSSATSPGCTFTAFTEPVIAIGPTKTEYTLTTYTSTLYDCDGCSDIDVVVLGHIFVVCTLLYSSGPFYLLRLTQSYMAMSPSSASPSYSQMLSFLYLP